MQLKKKTNNDQRMILAAMITDTVVCSRIASRWPPRGLFDDDDLNLIASWCIKYISKWGTAPGTGIRGIFDRWSEKPTIKEERSRVVEQKLQSVSDESSRNGAVTPDYVLDRANIYFNKVKLKQECELIEMDLENGEVEKAWNRRNQSTRIELGETSVIKVASDFAAWRECLDEERDVPLIGYPGKLQRFMGEMTSRENFLAFTAPNKSFKSFWTMDVGFRGLRNRLKVAFFEVGDMTKAQIMKRMAARFARRPIGAKSYKIPKEFLEEGKIRWETKTVEERLTPQEVFRQVNRVCRKRDLFRLSCHKNSSIDINGLQSILEGWSRENWVPDIILIDYADILAPPQGVSDDLKQIEYTWKAMRRMSQEFHCLLVTATQASALSFTNKKKTLGRQHFSGRRTKMDEVTGMIGLNVHADYRKRCLTGLNWINRRDGLYSEDYMLTVAGCLDIGNPAILCEEK